MIDWNEVFVLGDILFVLILLFVKSSDSKVYRMVLNCNEQKVVKRSDKTDGLLTFDWCDNVYFRAETI